MSDLIERPKSIGEAWRKLIQQQAEIERLEADSKKMRSEIRSMVAVWEKSQAEIERLQSERDGVVALYNASVRRVEQLQAVVDAADYLSAEVMDAWANSRLSIDTIDANDVYQKARAALEGADDE